ncbi:MAG: hypothetical protein ACE5HE_09165 [Phycisphaerae bacterium]
MKKKDVRIGEKYRAKVSGQVVKIRIDGESIYGGWNATNLRTGRRIRIRGVQRLRPLPLPPATRPVDLRRVEQRGQNGGEDNEATTL